MANVQIAIIDQENTQIALSAPSETQVNIAVPGVQGPQGPQGPVGQGVASGGTTNQVLFKQSSTDYDTAWSEITSDMIGDLEIVDADVSVTAAIAGTKISPNFGSQTVQTTGVVSHALGAAATPTITFTGDTNTGIYSPGADQLAISTGGTGRLFVGSTGNVGIGTSSPGAQLDILSSGFSNLRVRSSAANSATFNLTNSDRNYSFNTNGGNFYIRDESVTTERLRIDSSGRLLVGTTSSSNNVRAVFSGNSGSNTDGGVVYLRRGGSAVVVNTHIGTLGFAGGEGLYAQIRTEADAAPGANDSPGRLILSTTAATASSPTERLRITSAGLVGIGTQSPGHTLDVSGASTILRLQSSNSNAYLRFDTTVASSALIGSQSGAMVFNPSGGEAMRIDSAGRVGIGTSSPDTRLTIVGSDNSEMLRLYGSSGGNARGLKISTYQVSGSVDNAGVDFNAQQGSAGQLRFSTLSTPRVLIDSLGNVGIGTTSPSKTLDVVGDAKIVTTSATQNILLGVSSGGIGYKTQLDFGHPTVGARIESERLGANTQSSLSLWTTNSAGVISRALTVDQSQRVGIGTTSPSTSLHVAAPANHSIILERSGAVAPGSITLGVASFGDSRLTATRGMTLEAGTSGPLVFNTSGANERARIDSSGRLLVGTSTSVAAGSTAASTLQVSQGTLGIGATLYSIASLGAPGGVLVLGHGRGTASGLLAPNDVVGQVRFAGGDGVDLETQAALISAEVDGTTGANIMPGRLVFSTTAAGAANPTERMRITSEGYVFVDSSSSALPGFIKTTGTGLKVVSTTNTADAKIECFATSTATRYGIVFSDTTGIVGSISTNGSATAFNTSSDYRLKENIVPLTGAADRVNQLQVHRFNFITNPDTTFDGFLAHEAQAVVPECVTGTKDEVDADGNPVYQGIDQSKLVPLLTAALQEAIAKIESLEARLTAADI